MLSHNQFEWRLTIIHFHLDYSSMILSHKNTSDFFSQQTKTIKHMCVFVLVSCSAKAKPHFWCMFSPRIRVKHSHFLLWAGKYLCGIQSPLAHVSNFCYSLWPMKPHGIMWSTHFNKGNWGQNTLCFYLNLSLKVKTEESLISAFSKYWKCSSQQLSRAWFRGHFIPWQLKWLMCNRSELFNPHSKKA